MEGSVNGEAICRGLWRIILFYSVRLKFSRLEINQTEHYESFSCSLKCTFETVEDDFRTPPYSQVRLHGLRAVVLVSSPRNGSIFIILNWTRLAGFAGTIVDPEWFIAEQIAFSPSEKLSKNSIVVALQLGNIYLLLALVNIISSLH